MFKNKTVIVTGASMGVGKATALEFAKQGANVCIVDINEALLEDVKNQIADMGVNVTAYVCDVSDEARVQEVTADILRSYGKIDVLVNNAGLWRYFSAFIDTDSNLWKKLIDVNILGVMYFSRAVLGNMLKNKYGRIINIGSVAGTYGNANMVPYSMTKGAVSSFTKALAKEVAEHGITVNTVTIGNVRESDAEESSALSYMKRSGKPEEFACFIRFLASDEAAYISGHDHQIDGCRKKI